MIAVNTRDTERFYSLVDSNPSTLDPRDPSPEQLRPSKPAVLEHQPHEQVRVGDANCGQLSVKQRAHLDSLLHHFISDALKLFPIGTTVAKESDSEIIRGQVYDYRAPYWRVQYEDNDWEELSRQEVHRMAGAHQDDT